jgi:hypothetical protein
MSINYAKFGKNSARFRLRDCTKVFIAINSARSYGSGLADCAAPLTDRIARANDSLPITAPQTTPNIESVLVPVDVFAIELYNSTKGIPCA